MKLIIIIINGFINNKSTTTTHRNTNNGLPLYMGRGQEIEFHIVNVIGDGSGEIDESNVNTYLVEGGPLTPPTCLTEGDEARLTTIERSDGSLNITTFDQEVCAEPTQAPTTQPTTDPTKDPTTDPTSPPTPSPVQDYCERTMLLLDLVIIVDASCDSITYDECKQQQENIAETFSSIRGPEGYNKFFDGEISELSEVRVSYIEMGTDGTENSVDVIVNLIDTPLNHEMSGIGDGGIGERINFYNLIKDSTICDDIDTQDSPRSGNPDLYDALDAAIGQFELNPDSDDIGADKKILIFSNCGVPQDNNNPDDPNDREGICDKWEKRIRLGTKKGGRQESDNGINVVMVNSDNLTPGDPEEYIMCLVEYDQTRIIVQDPDAPNDCDDRIYFSGPNTLTYALGQQY